MINPSYSRAELREQLDKDIQVYLDAGNAVQIIEPELPPKKRTAKDPVQAHRDEIKRQTQEWLAPYSENLGVVHL